MKFSSFLLFPFLASTAFGANLADVAKQLIFGSIVDTDDWVGNNNVVPVPAPKLLQPHGRSCSPTCPPDDDEEEEDDVMVMEVPTPVPSNVLQPLSRPHSGSCGPTCPPDDDFMVEEEKELVPTPAPKLGRPHGGSCGPTCPPDDDFMVEEEKELVPTPAPKLGRPHGGSCGPTCPPDDDFMVEEEKELVPTPAPKLGRPHGGSCGPTCPPDDDFIIEETDEIIDPSPSRKNSKLRVEFIVSHNHPWTGDEQTFVQESLLASFLKAYNSSYDLDFFEIQFEKAFFIPVKVGGGLRAFFNHWNSMVDFIPGKRCHPQHDWTHHYCLVWAALEAWSVEHQHEDVASFSTLHAVWERKLCKILQKGPHDIFHDAVQCKIMLKGTKVAAFTKPGIQGIVGETEDVMVEAEE
jgi:hypothetical protein